MRKDPPVDEDYMNALHLLGLAQTMGTKVFNNPVSIKEFNEKVFAIHFAKYIPKTLISSKIDKIKSFIKDKQEIVVKPLDGMGGKSIYKMEKIQESEYETLLKNKIMNRYLGKNILRSETAPVVVAAIIRNHFGKIT